MANRAIRHSIPEKPQDDPLISTAWSQLRRVDFSPIAAFMTRISTSPSGQAVQRPRNWGARLEPLGMDLVPFLFTDRPAVVTAVICVAPTLYRGRFAARLKSFTSASSTQDPAQQRAEARARVSRARLRSAIIIERICSCASSSWSAAFPPQDHVVSFSLPGVDLKWPMAVVVAQSLEVAKCDHFSVGARQCTWQIAGDIS